MMGLRQATDGHVANDVGHQQLGGEASMRVIESKCEFVTHKTPI
jgi:hypothetical protein